MANSKRGRPRGITERVKLEVFSVLQLMQKGLSRRAAERVVAMFSGSSNLPVPSVLEIAPERPGRPRKGARIDPSGPAYSGVHPDRPGGDEESDRDDDLDGDAAEERHAAWKREQARVRANVRSVLDAILAARKIRGRDRPCVGRHLGPRAIRSRPRPSYLRPLSRPRGGCQFIFEEKYPVRYEWAVRRRLGPRGLPSRVRPYLRPRRYRRSERFDVIVVPDPYVFRTARDGSYRLAEGFSAPPPCTNRSEPCECDRFAELYFRRVLRSGELRPWPEGRERPNPPPPPHRHCVVCNRTVEVGDPAICLYNRRHPVTYECVTYGWVCQECEPEYAKTLTPPPWDSG